MNEIKKMYKDLDVQEVGSSEFKISAKLDAGELSALEDVILKDRAKNMVIPGFRKGEAPMDLVKKQLGATYIKEEAAKELAAKALSQIIIEKQLKVVGTPNIDLGELVDGQDIEMEAKVVTLPEVEVGGYETSLAKINAEPLEEVVATDEDVENVIEHLRREKARILTIEAMQKNGGGKDMKMPDINAIPKDKLPNLEPVDFKELAGAENLEDFKTKVKENIKTEKEMAQKENRRAKLAEELLKFVKVDLPAEIVKMERERADAQMQQDLQMMGITLDVYLAQIGKKKEEFEAEMNKAAEDRAKLQLALDKIAMEKNIRPTQEEIQKEVDHVLSHNPQANPQDVAAFVDAQISNQKVFEYLESIK